ncbi:MAG: Crp/Fnr family transcriptional regulator [Acutalibacteraceae bacterium]|nr:Crp/Fnr family transcriptional regulator [Acutalibacteraceae bacterium]
MNIEHEFEAHLPFWSHLTADQRALLVSGTSRRSFRAGENVHGRTGDCTGILLVLSGELRSYFLSEDGREVTLYRLLPGSLCILSASCVLETITFDVSIDAEVDTDLLVVRADVFNRLTKENIYMDRDVHKEAVARFSDVMWTMQQVLFMKMDRRLAIFLTEEVLDRGADTLRMTHDQIARHVGSAREVITRMLKYFAAEGLVELGRGTVTVTDPEGIRALAGVDDGPGGACPV